ncbi:MAG: 50S ribosomal protein L10 [Patescibacteria group bacterium]|nr:50S ribosomal protein L10 [Patescibacteria group bacterium]
MALTKDKKKEILSAIRNALEQTASSVYVGFKGITVAEIGELRAALRKESVRYTVVKKTLLEKALSEKGYAGAMPALPGEVALAYLAAGEDVTAPARALQAFVKKFKDKLVFLGGAIEGRFLSREEMVAVATIPPMPVLRGMFVNIINSPIQRFAIALGEVAKSKQS